MTRYDIINAIEQNRLNPTTFEIPDKDDLDALKVRDWVKLGFEQKGNNTERMWVYLTKLGIKDNIWQGTLDNTPIQIFHVSELNRLKHGDLISFKTENIMSTMINK